MKPLQYFVVLLFAGVLNLQAQNTIPVDSIYILRDLSRDKETYSPQQRLRFAKRSSELARQTGIDSIILNNNLDLAIEYLNLGDLNTYLKLNHKSLKLAIDSKSNRIISVASLNIGGYYGVRRNIDSAFYYLYKSLKYNNYNKAEDRHSVHLYLSYMEGSTGNYAESEYHSIKALKFIDELPETITLQHDKRDIYYYMASILRREGNYKMAIDYNNKSLIISKELKDKLSELHTLNNMAEVYRELDKYEEAISLYEEALYDESIKIEDPIFYAMLLVNKAYAQFQKGNNSNQNIISQLKLGYRINDTLDRDYEKLLLKSATSYYLSKVYQKSQQKDSSYKYAKEAYAIAKDIGENEILLDALLVLSELEDGDKGKAHLREHIRINDSLLQLERSNRDKFARIRYGTGQIETEKDKVEKERDWLYGISIGLISIAMLILVIIAQRYRNNKLQFAKDQQQANEEIYQLMITQQNKLEEGRHQERYRISEELHDGVLSKLFGVRLGLGFINVKGQTQDDVDKYKAYMGQIQTLEKDIRILSHDLRQDGLSSKGSFNEIIHTFITKQCELHNFKSTFTTENSINWSTIAEKTKVHIYRIIQESMHNVIKHAEATELSINFKKENETILVLEISDNGKGFDAKVTHRGIGLKNVASRVKKLKGDFNIASIKEKGTTLRISIAV